MQKEAGQSCVGCLVLLVIRPANARMVLANLDLAIAYLGEIASGTREDTPSVYPWFRVIQEEAEDASSWYNGRFGVSAER